MAISKSKGGFVATGVRQMLRIFAMGALSFASSQVSAAVTITSATVTNYTYGFYNATIPTTGIGNVNKVDVDLPNPLSQISLDTVSTSSGGSFFFLHNNYCLGQCYITATTFTVLSIANLGTEAMQLSLDSQITAGYMAFQSSEGLGTDNNTRAGFNFAISQQTSDANSNTVVPAHQLYAANGQASGDNFFIETSDHVAFTGLTSTDDGTARYFEWNPTNLDLSLGVLLPGFTTTIIYQSTTQVSANSACGDLGACDGAQVAFGDPRNNGGVSDFGRGVAEMSAASLPVIGRQFGAADLKLVVQSSAVPEPASWAMLIIGFIVAGGIMRRQPVYAAA